MGTCSDHKETLVLDVYGELTPEERITWENHLAVCGDCRQEKESLLSLIQKARQSHSPAPLTSEEEHLLSSRVQRTLRTQKPEPARKRLGWRIAPALGACMVILFAGYFSLKDFRSPDTLTVNSNAVLEEQVIEDNEELLENMELLQEMEALEQLVNLLDKQYPETSLLDSGRDANYVGTHV